MIQRLQSLLLLLAAIANFAALFLPYGFAEDNRSNESPRAYMSATSIRVDMLVTGDNEHLFEGKDVKFGNYHTETIGPGDSGLLLVHVILLVSNVAFILFLIFLYGNRQRQAQLCYAAIGSVMVQITISAALFYSKLPELVGATAEGASAENFDASPQYGMFIPVIAMGLIWWASKRIKHDEKLVRDSNRFR